MYDFSPIPVFCIFVLQNIVGKKNKTKCGWLSATIKWRHSGHSQLLFRAVALITRMAEMGVSPQEEMANPQDMEVFPVERHGLPKDFVVVLCVESNRRHSYCATSYG